MEDSANDTFAIDPLSGTVYLRETVDSEEVR